MQIVKDTETRLVFQQQGNEKRIIAVLGAVGFLGLGAFFYFSGDADARLFAYIFGGCGVLFAGLIFMPTTAETLILDLEEGLLILRVPSGGKRRVYTVPFDIIAGVSVQERGSSHSGYYKQVEFAMTEASRKKPLTLPVGFTGMSHDDIHATIVRWATRNGAFPTDPAPAD